MSGSPASFRQQCELVGTAQPAHIGTVNAPQTGRECVWYRHKVTEEYWDYEHQDADNPGRERSRESRTVKEDVSDIPFALVDTTGQAVIYTDRLEVDHPERVFDELQEDKDQGFADLLKEFAQRSRDDRLPDRGVDPAGRHASCSSRAR